MPLPLFEGRMISSMPVSGAQRLPNGNTVITSYYAKGDQVKLTEVTPEKKVVWRFNALPSSFHHFQILTTNGKPEGALK